MDDALKMVLEQIQDGQSRQEDKLDAIQADLSDMKTRLNCVQNDVLRRVEQDFVRHSEFGGKWQECAKAARTEQLEAVERGARLIRIIKEWGGYIVAIVIFLSVYGDKLVFWK